VNRIYKIRIYIIYIKRCDICDYSTTTKGNLSIHMQSDKHINNLKELKENKSVDNSSTPSILTSTAATSGKQAVTPSGLHHDNEHLNTSMEESTMSDSVSKNPLRLIKNKLPHINQANSAKQAVGKGKRPIYSVDDSIKLRVRVSSMILWVDYQISKTFSNQKLARNLTFRNHIHHCVSYTPCLNGHVSAE